MTEQTDDKRWVLRAEGVNFGDTIWATTDLSCIRGASLCLEALAIELMAWFEEQKIDAILVAHGASVAAFDLPKMTASEALKVRGDVDKRLRESYSAKQDEPLVMTVPLRASGELLGDRRAQAFHQVPSEHMSVMVDVEEVVGDDLSAALRRAAIRNRRRQMRSPNVPRAPGLNVSGGLGAMTAVRCPIDPLRFLPDDNDRERATVVMAEDQYPAAIRIDDEALPKGLKRVCVSQRVSDLRTYGRSARREIYDFQISHALVGAPDADAKASLTTDELPSIARLESEGLFETHDFARSFADIVVNPDPDLPKSLQGKLAFLHFDGNGFSELRDEVGDTRTFSAFVRLVNAQVMERLLLHVLQQDTNGPRPWSWTHEAQVPIQKGGKNRYGEQRLLRLETLMFGGEDAVMVAPAWLGFELAELGLRLFEESAAKACRHFNLTPDPMPSWRVGMLICDARTPARRAAFAAYKLCEDAKKAHTKATGKTSYLSWHISESHDVPELSGGADSIGVLRSFYGDAGLLRDKVAEVPEAFRTAGPGIANLIEGVSELKQMFPKSQVYRLIQALRDKRTASRDANMAPNDMDSEIKALAEALALVANRSRKAIDTNRVSQLLPGKGLSPLMRLIVLAELWDYVDPFNEWVPHEEPA